MASVRYTANDGPDMRIKCRSENEEQGEVLYRKEKAIFKNEEKERGKETHPYKLLKG